MLLVLLLICWPLSREGRLPGEWLLLRPSLPHLHTEGTGTGPRPRPHTTATPTHHRPHSHTTATLSAQEAPEGLRRQMGRDQAHSHPTGLSPGPSHGGGVRTGPCLDVGVRARLSPTPTVHSRQAHAQPRGPPPGHRSQGPRSWNSFPGPPPPVTGTRTGRDPRFWSSAQGGGRLRMQGQEAVGAQPVPHPQARPRLRSSVKGS